MDNETILPIESEPGLEELPAADEPQPVPPAVAVPEPVPPAVAAIPASLASQALAHHLDRAPGHHARDPQCGSKTLCAVAGGDRRRWRDA
jgi:hypothetical protein